MSVDEKSEAVKGCKVSGPVRSFAVRRRRNWFGARRLSVLESDDLRSGRAGLWPPTSFGVAILPSLGFENYEDEEEEGEEDDNTSTMR